MENLVDEETKLSFKLNRLLTEYDLGQMFDVSEFESAIPEVKASIELFEDVHVRLKRGLGEGEYLKMYPDFFHRLKPMTDWVGNARRNLRQRIREVEKEKKDMVEQEWKGKEEAESKRRAREVDFQVNREKDRLRNKVKNLHKRIDSDLRSM